MTRRCDYWGSNRGLFISTYAKGSAASVYTLLKSGTANALCYQSANSKKHEGAKGAVVATFAYRAVYNGRYV